MHYYLGAWEFATDAGFSRWRTPGGDGFCIDLRNRDQRLSPTPGLGLFAYPSARAYPQLLLDLGDDLQAVLSAQQRTGLSSLLGFSPPFGPTTTLAGTIRRLLLDPALTDPAGVSAWKPVRAKLGGDVCACLGPEVFRERCARGHDALIARRNVFRADYRRTRAERDPVALRKWTGQMMLDLTGRLSNLDVADVLPPEFAADGYARPTTTINDTFNRGDQSNLGTSSDTTWSWVEVASTHDISSNQCISGTSIDANHVSRANTNLSSDDHYAQIDVVTFPQPTTDNRAIVAGTVARLSTDADPNWDGYFGRVLYFDAGSGGSAQLIDLYEVTNGSFSQIGSNDTVTISLPDTIKTEADNSTITTYFNGTASTAATGTNGVHTGQLQTGIYGFNRDANYVLDNYEAADLGAGPAANPKGPLGMPLHGPFGGPI